MCACTLVHGTHTTHTQACMCAHAMYVTFIHTHMKRVGGSEREKLNKEVGDVFAVALVVGGGGVVGGGDRKREEGGREGKIK